jgi:4-carboxymuconolactone decarboxylase
MDERRRAKRGLAVRRAVLGPGHVERALRTRTPFNREFQDLLTRYAWGEIWTRPGLPRRTRSLVTLAVLAAQNHKEELRLHLLASLRNGVTREEIKEVLLQMAIYCGLPAANSAFQVAAEVFAEVDARGVRIRRRARPTERQQ